MSQARPRLKGLLLAMGLASPSLSVPRRYIVEEISDLGLD